jgi:hypothetical protein
MPEMTAQEIKEKAKEIEKKEFEAKAAEFQKEYEKLCLKYGLSFQAQAVVSVVSIQPHKG